MLLIIFLLNSGLLLLALTNYATMRRSSIAREIKSSIAILLPVRNEEENIERIVKELSAQTFLNHYQIIVINDGSTDRTVELATALSSPNLVITNAPALPSGWIGKVGALHHGLSKTNADYIVSIDADVSFAPDALSRAIATLEDLNLDYICPYPCQVAITWGERLIQPLLQWSWMSTLFLRGAERFPLQSTVVANGQFFLIKTSALTASGGFEAVSSQVLDDIELARSLVRAGFRGTVVDGSELATTRMYQSFTEIRAGYGKSLHRAFGGLLGSILTSLFFFATGILPLFYALTGNLFALASLIAIISTRAVSAYASSTRTRDALLHPVSAALFIYLLYYSWSHRKSAQWKGRTL